MREKKDREIWEIPYVCQRGTQVGQRPIGCPTSGRAWSAAKDLPEILLHIHVKPWNGVKGIE